MGLEECHEEGQHISNPFSADDTEDNNKMTTENQSWKSKILGNLRYWMKKCKMDGSSVKKKRLARAMVAAFAAIILYRMRRLTSKQKLWWLLATFFQKPEHHEAIEVSLSALRDATKQSYVNRALIGDSEIVFRSSDGRWKRSQLPPNSQGLKSDLMEMLSSGGCTDIRALPESLWQRLATPAIASLPFVYLALMYKVLRNLHGGDMGSRHTNDARRKQTKFSDIAGLDHLMKELYEVVSFLRNPLSFQFLGAHPPRGILFHGPPGSGKTLLARAIAGESDCAFIACSGSEFCEMYVGRGASRIRSLFEQARTAALGRWKSNSWLQSFANPTQTKTSTAILFIDEFDALAKSRSYGGITSNEEREQTLNQLLTEMDGFPSEMTDVAIIVIAATNRPDILDPAILRRFDRHLHVPYPNEEGRKGILMIHAKRINCNIEEIDWDTLASEKVTGNCSGSDLRNMINDAALLAVRDQSPIVAYYHLMNAAKRFHSMRVKTLPVQMYQS